MPVDYEYSYGYGNTTLYVLRESWHYIGEFVDTAYPSWENSSVVTKINETLIWMHITPTTAVGENFTWIDADIDTGTQTTYPENTSSITNITNDAIVVTHTPSVNDTIDIVTVFGSASYTVENVTDDKINASYVIDDGGNKSYLEFDRTTTIQRNETQNITDPPYPGELLEEQLFPYLRSLYPDFNLSCHEYAGKTLYFEVEIVKLYKTSQQS
jgi:hypothetical protein